MRFQCRGCGEEHDELPMAFHAAMPQAWMEVPEDEEEERGVLSSDQCELDGNRFFIRGIVKIAVEGRKTTLDWGVWCELPRDSYERMVAQWQTEGREREPPLEARLATSLPSVLYAETVGLPVRVHSRPVGERPLVEVIGDHRLAVEQSFGITRERLEKIWALLLHRDDDDDELDREQYDDREDDGDA